MAVPQLLEPQEPFMTRVVRWPQEIRDYFEDLRKEMRLVSWPTRDQVVATTMVVIIAVFVFAAYFWLVDLGMSFIMTRLFALGGK